jgi:hypothetical protein
MEIVKGGPRAKSRATSTSIRWSATRDSSYPGSSHGKQIQKKFLSVPVDWALASSTYS